jgi:hypothetical protein
MDELAKKMHEMALCKIHFQRRPLPRFSVMTVSHKNRVFRKVGTMPDLISFLPAHPFSAGQDMVALSAGIL